MPITMKRSETYIQGEPKVGIQYIVYCTPISIRYIVYYTFSPSCICGKHVQTITEHQGLKDSWNRLLWKLATANL